MNIFQEYISYGLSVIPCNADKRPQFAWKQYQSTIAGKEAAEWSGAIACVCGAVSGGLICIDFDIKNGEKYTEWVMLINENYPDLLGKLVIEQSPSGGKHVIFRSDKQIKNIKLANNQTGQATIETRGEGGYFL